MELTNERILQHQLNQFEAEVIMAACTELIPGWSDNRVEPDFYRLCYVASGEGWLTIDGQAYEGKQGKMYLLSPGGEQALGSNEKEAFEIYWCYYRMDDRNDFSRQFLQLPLSITVQDEQLIKELFIKMIDAQHSSLVTRDIKMKSVLLELMAYYLDECQLQAGSLQLTAGNEKWNEVLCYIEHNLHQNIQVEDLAKVVYLHPNYFITAFKTIMGCSPIQYVTQRRLISVKQMLADTAMPITEIARKVGMLNHYLSRLFKRNTGITPVQYRRIIQARGRDLRSLETLSLRGDSLE
ncbi:MAG: AraC family transcriptional regulator [Candidatus Pristimantibacillus sp.]